MDIEKPSYADKPLVFALHADWRPRQLEEAEAAIGLPSAKTRDRQLVRGYILGAAIQIGRENPEQWISYSRDHNYYADPARKTILARQQYVRRHRLVRGPARQFGVD